jgi:penicillin-binding protein 2
VEVFNRQLKIATLVVLAVFAVLVLRLWYLQVMSGSVYRTQSENNRLQLYDIPPVRGMIYDRRGELLVGNRPCYDLYVVPEGIPDREDLTWRMKQVVGLDPERMDRRLSATSPTHPFRPICLETDISRDKVAVIETHRFNLPGTMIRVKPQRHYVNRQLASHLLGYVGEVTEKQLHSEKYEAYKRGDLVGKSGVERGWEFFLNGSRGGEQVEVDAVGRRIRVLSRKPPEPGASVYLTLDKRLQSVAEQALAEKKGAVTAIDPSNGEILAMASSPAFDPNWFAGGIDSKRWKKISTSPNFPLQNRCLSGQYPPGSVFKIVVALAGLEEGVIDPEEEVLCNGVYYLGNRSYRCWRKQGHGRVSLHRALRESCDVYFYKMGQRLGVTRIAEYATRLGLGKSTGIDPLQEKRGLVPTHDWKMRKYGVPWQPGETVSLSIGQSFILVTPIQMANLIAAVFNGGVLYQPQLTQKVLSPQGETLFQSTPVVAGKSGISPEHLRRVQKALIGVVNEPHGTGGRCKLKGVTVAGKTGTAQVVALATEDALSESGELPEEFRDHAWFVAIAPAEAPRIAVSVILEHSGHGGRVAAPVAKKLIQAYLGHEG